MALTIRKLHELFAGEATGVDLTRPLDAVETAAIVAAMERYAVLVFSGQNLTGEQQVAFSEGFGDLETPRQEFLPGCQQRRARYARRRKKEVAKNPRAL